MSNEQSSDVGILSALAEVDDKTFEDDDWNVITFKCKSLAAKWEQLSAFLGLPSALIDQIRHNHPNDSSGCWNEALSQWIKQNYSTEKFGKPSWKTLLCQAIEYVDRRLFEKLASEHKRHVTFVDRVLPFTSEGCSQVTQSVDEGDMAPEKDSSEKQRQTAQSCGASKTVAKLNILDTYTVGENQLTFPFLDVKEMSKEKQKDLQERLYVESVEMMEKFQNLLSGVTKSLKERDVSKSSILCHLMGLGQLKPVYEDPPLPVFRRQLHELKKAKDIEEVMLGIGDYCSFFNFQLIEQIVEKLGTDTDRGNMSKYKEDFDKYAIRKVFECPSKVSSTNEKGLIKLYVTLDETYESCTVSHLQLFTSYLKKKHNIPSMLILHQIESGSLKLTFLLFYDQYRQMKIPLAPSIMNSRMKGQLEYPKQTVLHKLNSEYLTLGEDGFYYKIRDYNLNETDLLGSGEFGSVLWAQDLTTEKMFAIKQNKYACFKSIEYECLILSHLAENDHIVRFLGAVIDERELPTQPPLVCKMMMELAENGNLAEMLRDEDGLEAPLPDDQSLYYLQQILEGVNFLHQSGYLHLDLKSQNVLVFDGGCTVKLTDFDAAVALSDAPRRLNHCTPYFAAPEIVKGEVPKVSADIWNVLCILVEMLTARWPGCHTVVRNEMAMMFMIGSYEDHMINELISLNKLDVEPEIKQLFIDVFRKEPMLRPSAVELLNRPVIMNAVEYGRYFDEYYDSEDAEELDPASTTGCDDIPIAEGPQQISLTSSSSQVSFHSIGDEVSELPQFPCNQQRNRGSQDSGVGGDLENSIGSSAVFGSQKSMRSSSSGSNKRNNQQRLLHQDLGLEDMIDGECSQPGPVYCSSIPVHHMDIPPASVNPYSRQCSSSLNKSGGFSNLNFSSLPQAPPPPADYIMVQRSYSFSGRGATKRSDSSSRSQIRATVGLNHVAKRHRPNSIHPKLHNLTHSYSAPSIGFIDPWRKRRHSLQHLDSYGTGETWEVDTEADRVNPMGRSHLRRTSSEVYVDRGPDIDTPEKEKNRLQELLSGLTLGSAHPPKSSAPIPARRQMSDAGDTHSATSSLSGSSTTSIELSDSKKQFDESGDHEDDHPPANGSQAFQIC